MPYIFTIVSIVILVLGIRPVAADFATAEVAELRGDVAAGYQACKTDAKAGDARCQNYLGVMSGRGAAQHASEAVRLFRLAAVQGLAAVQYNLGRAYAAGHGVRKNQAEAARWYRMAAEQGDPAAQNASPFSMRRFVAFCAIPRRRSTCFDAPRRTVMRSRSSISQWRSTLAA